MTVQLHLQIANHLQCSTGTPCMSCLKNGNGLHEIKCQRESPFVGKLVHQCMDPNFRYHIHTELSQTLNTPLQGE